MAITITALLATAHPATHAGDPASLPATSMATALTVDGQAVPLRQLMLQVEADRAATFAYFQQKYQATASGAFWHTRFENTTPTDYLTEHAIADTVTIAVERRLAQSHGLLADAGYPAFLRSWTAENSRRSTALTAHQVVYGPPQYSEAGYFTYTMSGLGSRLEQALAADGSISVSDADATAYYLAHPEKFQSAGTQGSNAPQAGPRSTAPFQTVEAQVRQLFLDDAFQACLASLAVHATVVRHDDVLAHVPLG